MGGCRVSITVGSSEQAREMSVKLVLLGAEAGMRDQCLSVLFKLLPIGTNPPAILYGMATMAFTD